MSAAPVGGRGVRSAKRMAVRGPARHMRRNRMTRSTNSRLARWYFAGTIVAVLAAAQIWADGATASERYALLVGVTRYDNLRPSYQLKGPANDVELLAGILPGLGF